EPTRIKKSSLAIRKAFAKGVLMFDGCVTKGGRIAFSSKSRKLASAIIEIWENDNMRHGKLHKNKRGEWTIYTTAQNKYFKLLAYFEERTQKQKLLRWIHGEKEAEPIIKKSSHLSIQKILSVLKKIKRCDINFLEHTFRRRYSTIRHYLKILENQKSIRISSTPYLWSSCISEKAAVYLNKKTHDIVFLKIRERFGLGKNTANTLGIHKATFSAWKLRKNRIPIGTLKRLCPLLNIKFEVVTKGVIQTDRDIIELI
ncbi:MAG: hypothetical protein Q8Q03_01465, partial [bacterium]|nr:hypothetical protein [bacterium]